MIAITFQRNLIMVEMLVQIHFIHTHTHTVESSLAIKRNEDLIYAAT